MAEISLCSASNTLRVLPSSAMLPQAKWMTLNSTTLPEGLGRVALLSSRRSLTPLLRTQMRGLAKGASLMRLSGPPVVGVRSRLGDREAHEQGKQGANGFGFGKTNLLRKKERSDLLRTKAAESDVPSVEASSPSLLQQGVGGLHLAVSLGLFLALDKFLKQTFVSAGIKFPSALFGMFCIFTSLVLTDLVKPEAAAALIRFFQPGIMFIQRWLPLFYVPSLVVIPLAVQGIPTDAAAKIAVLFAGGWAVSLAVAGYTTVLVRKLVNTSLQPPEYTPKPPPFSDFEFKALAAAVVAFFGLAVYSPTALGTTAATTLPFYLAVTAFGYVFGTNLPANLRKVFHPIITCALSANLAAYVYGRVTGVGFESALKFYMTKQAENPGAGDIYMGFLGSVILSFAFSMFRQRVLVKRHAAEIFSAVLVSSLFSMYSTAAGGRLIGLASNLTLAIVPRCVTVALALPIAGLLEAGNPSLTAAVVVLTGLIGANFTQGLMDTLGFSDPITRGMATATSAHGLGTAALSAKEPEALPFCAIAYALTGICCSVLVSIPVIQQSLLHVAGHGVL